MRKILSTTSLSLLLLPLLSGCVVTQDQFKSLNLVVRNQDNRLVELEQRASAGSDATGSVQKQQADLSQEIERLSTELLQIKAQLDESNHRSRNLRQENEELRQELANRLAGLEELSQNQEQKLVGLGTNLSSVQLQMEEEALRRAEAAKLAAKEARDRAAAAAEAKRKADEAKRRAAEAAAAKAAAEKAAASGIKEIKPGQFKVKKGEQPAAALSSPAPVPESSPASTPTANRNEAEKLYDTALGHYRSDNFKDAIKSFTTFLDQHPKDKLAPNARYWLGASMLKSGDYSGAVLEFQNIVDGYPNHPKAPEALLQQAKAFEHFGEKAVQIKLYKDVLAYYPNSEQAKTAKKMLNKLQ